MCEPVEPSFWHGMNLTNIEVLACLCLFYCCCYFYLFVFQYRGSLYNSLGCPEIYWGDQTGLELTETLQSHLPFPGSGFLGRITWEVDCARSQGKDDAYEQEILLQDQGHSLRSHSIPLPPQFIATAAAATQSLTASWERGRGTVKALCEGGVLPLTLSVS